MRLLRLSRRTLAACAVAVLLGSAGTALALDPKPYEAPGQPSQADLNAMKAKSKSNMVGYGKDVSVVETPFPWNSFILGCIVVAVMIPIGYSAYKNAAKELQANGPNARPPPPRSLDE